MQTKGKRNPEKVAKAERDKNLQATLSKRPKKGVKNMTSKEREDAITAMLEWWMDLDG